MSARHAICRSFLVASRAVAKKNGTPTDKGFGVTHTTDRSYWLVQDAKGKTLYEGDAHCGYCARSEAIAKAVA